MHPNSQGGTVHYSNAGTNTLTQVTNEPIRLNSISVDYSGGATTVAFLQVYNNGTADIAEPGTGKTFALAVYSGTAGAGTPSLAAHRDVNYGPNGIRFDNGLSYMWSTSETGTGAVTGNARVMIVADKIG